MKKKDFLAGKENWILSLSKLTGKKIIDVTGWQENPFDSPCIFEIHRIVFEDGTMISIHGEHDIPYIDATEDIPNLDEKTLKKLA